jgi:predicted MPP superfamily phosphohydrolase
MPLRHWVGWLHTQALASAPPGRLARLIGRNWARVSYGYRVEPTWLELNRLAVPVAGLPAAFAGFRIIQLTDFHGSRQVTPFYLGEAVELALAQNPDLVVLTGDFIHHGHRHVERVARALGRLAAPHGVYAVLGNHDYSVRNALGFRRYRHLHRAVTDALRANGIGVLRNQTVRVARAGAALHLVGLADLWSRECDVTQAYHGLNDHLPCVVLAHNPRTIERLGGRRCDLMLSGHTHGGQVNWPGLGRVTLGHHARRLAAGLYRYHGSWVYVNKGVGFGFRFRLGVRPEVAVLTLTPPDQGG